MPTLRVETPPAGFPFPAEELAMWTMLDLEAVDGGRMRLGVTGLGFGEGAEHERLRDFFDRGDAVTIARLEERIRAGRPLGHGAPPQP